MNRATLDGCIAKVRRAEVLNKRFELEWVAFLKTNPYPSRVEVDHKSGWNRVYFDFSTPPPGNIPVIVGEIAHDLRSALDHLVWQEAVECLGREPTADEGRSIAFLCARSSARFKKSPTRYHVGKDAWALMERHQPYKRTAGQRPKSLGLLHWFNRIDKHRTLQVASVLSLPELGFPPEFIDWNREQTLVLEFDPIKPYRRLKRETEVLALRFDPNGPDPHVRVKGTPAVAIGFRDVPRPLRGITLTETIQEVHRVVADFTQLLP